LRIQTTPTKAVEEDDAKLYKRMYNTNKNTAVPSRDDATINASCTSCTFKG